MTSLLYKRRHERRRQRPEAVPDRTSRSLAARPRRSGAASLPLRCPASARWFPLRRRLGIYGRVRSGGAGGSLAVLPDLAPPGGLDALSRRRTSLPRVLQGGAQPAGALGVRAAARDPPARAGRDSDLDLRAQHPPRGRSAAEDPLCSAGHRLRRPVPDGDRLRLPRRARRPPASVDSLGIASRHLVERRSRDRLGAVRVKNTLRLLRAERDWSQAELAGRF